MEETMGTTVVGIILIVIGVLALLGGIGGGLAELFLETKKKWEQGQSGVFDLPVETIKALKEFLDALAKAPKWLALSILGIFLIGWGGSML
jgi:hypothetical protein